MNYKRLCWLLVLVLWLQIAMMAQMNRQLRAVKTDFLEAQENWEAERQELEIDLMKLRSR